MPNMIKKIDLAEQLGLSIIEINRLIKTLQNKNKVAYRFPQNAIKLREYLLNENQVSFIKEQLELDKKENTDNVFVKINNEYCIDSNKIAIFYNMRHIDVLHRVEDIIETFTNFGNARRKNFNKMLDKNNGEGYHYIMNREGFEDLSGTFVGLLSSRCTKIIMKSFGNK